MFWHVQVHFSFLYFVNCLIFKFKCCDFLKMLFLNPDKTKIWDLIFIHNRVQFERSLGRCSWNCIFKLHVISWREAGFNLRFLKKLRKLAFFFAVCLFVWLFILGYKRTTILRLCSMNWFHTCQSNWKCSTECRTWR